MQDRPVLGGVDAVSAQHAVAAFFQAHCAGQVDQQPEGSPVDPVQAVVDEQVTGGDGEIAATFGVGVEQLPQVQVGHVGVVGL